MELASKADWANAADRFSRSDALRHSPVVSYNLATAWVELGRLVEASEVLRQIDKDPAAKQNLRRDAQTLLKSLEPRIATLVVTLESGPTRQEVRVNDRALSEAALGVPTPVDPGTVEIAVVDQGGAVLWTKRVEVLPGGMQRVTIELPKQAAAAPEPAPTPIQTAAALPMRPAPRVDLERRQDQPKDSTTLWEEPWLWVGAGAVVAGTLVAVLLASSGGTTTEASIQGNLRPGRLTVPE